MGSAKIHPTALVSPGAQIGEGVEIGPYAVLGRHVKVGSHARILSHVVIEGFTTIGRRCVIFPGACLGAPPQDKKFRDCEAYLLMGDDNIIREHVTMHHGSKPGSATRIGDRNFFMIGAHVGHDCVLGNDIVIVNGSALGGHVTVEDGAVVGGMAGIHQFARVGKLSMIGAKSKVVMDVPPFSIYDGHPARFYGMNAVGLRRAGYTSKRSLPIKGALKILFASGSSLPAAIKKVKSQFKDNPDIDYLISFTRNSERGVARDAASLDAAG